MKIVARFLISPFLLSFSSSALTPFRRCGIRCHSMMVHVNLRHHPAAKLLVKNGRAKLARRHLDLFAGNSLFDRVARVLCETGCVPRKELFEWWEKLPNVFVIDRFLTPRLSTSLKVFQRQNLSTQGSHQYDGSQIAVAATVCLAGFYLFWMTSRW